MDNSGVIGEVLFVFFVLALIFEVAFTPVFNWRIFIKNFDNKGLKTPIVIIIAYLFCATYELDIVRDLLQAMDKLPEDSGATFWGQLITAFLIAGGSDAFVRIFKKLGIRDPSGRKKEVLGDS